ncbi:MAG TPA: hypothetical protein DCS93_14270 [Microscillaceae bacterium]|nr:hypothetical protein [Microscillaceae bacterium]
MKTLIFIGLLAFSATIYAQNTEIKELPYHQIPDYPANYEAGSMVARMIDGLGYRFYWATEGLTEKDLAFRPSEKARNTLETIQHIYDLTVFIINIHQGLPAPPRNKNAPLAFQELRQKILFNLQKASQLMVGKNAQAFSKHPIIFKRGDKESKLPYWHMINGPIADAIYHTGQLVSFRRMSGNPMNPKVSVFMGKNRK